MKYDTFKLVSRSSSSSSSSSSNNNINKLEDTLLYH
jgi:hypothetical protein